MASALYQTIIKTADKVVPKALEPLWQHPAGKVVWLHPSFSINNLKLLLVNAKKF